MQNSMQNSAKHAMQNYAKHAMQNSAKRAESSMEVWTCTKKSSRPNPTKCATHNKSWTNIEIALGLTNYRRQSPFIRTYRRQMVDVRY